MKHDKNFRFTERWSSSSAPSSSMSSIVANFMDDSVLGVNALPNSRRSVASSFGAIQQRRIAHWSTALKLYF